VRTDLRFLVLLLSFHFLSCYTQSLLDKGVLPPADRTIVFHLLNGSFIKSPAGMHLRVEDGYMLTGHVIEKGLVEQDFEGVILDDEIIGISTLEFNEHGTVALIGGATLVTVLIATSWGQAGF